MLFALICVDKPGAENLRLANRQDHLAYARESGMVTLGGPFLAEDGETMIGSLIIIEAPDRAAAEAFVDKDPYMRAGLFEHVEIRPWKRAIG